MANKPLKSIQFPGLSDTYTVPQVDASLATSGAAADAKKVGDEISDLKQDYNTLSAEVGDIGMYTLGLYPQKSVADVAVASFADGADDIPVKSLTVDITPVQSGTGDPSPENVRPISGWTGANVSVFDVNVWDEVWENGIYSPTTGEPLSDSNYIRSKNKIAVISGTEYYVKKPSSAGFRILYYDNSDAFISSETVADSWTGKAVTIPSNAKYVRIYCGTSTYNHDISVNYPSTDHDYHAYKGNVYSIDWTTEAGTVYGGTLDVTSGVLRVDKKLVSFGTPSKYTAWESDHTFSVATLNDADTSETAYFACSRYAQITMNDCFTGRLNGFFFRTDNKYLYISDSNCTTVEAMTSVLANTQLVYELATPVTYQLTPTEVTTLLKNNNIFADTGNVAELTYRADLKAYIDEKLA